MNQRVLLYLSLIAIGINLVNHVSSAAMRYAYPPREHGIAVKALKVEFRHIDDTWGHFKTLTNPTKERVNEFFKKWCNQCYKYIMLDVVAYWSKKDCDNNHDPVCIITENIGNGVPPDEQSVNYIMHRLRRMDTDPNRSWQPSPH